MKITERDVSIFRAVIKALGVWQLLMGLHSLIEITLVFTGISSPAAFGVHTREEHIAWAVILFAEALALLFGTDIFCRLAFSRATLDPTPPGDD